MGLFINAGADTEAVLKKAEMEIDSYLAGELFLELKDEEWPFEYTDHDRDVVRAVVFDDEGWFYFVHADRDDEFGRSVLIETSGGGVEKGEDLEAAVKRELREELGAEVEIVRRIGLVSDQYNLIHRHNLNNYYLCRAVSFGDRSLTEQEVSDYHLSTMKLTYEDALKEYEKCRGCRLGRVIAAREVPVLRKAKEILDGMRAEG